MSPRPKQTSQPSDLRERIMTTAWEQIAAQGASGLSLRAIARALNITAPAIYNYFPRRDDLVTAMIIDAFCALGESQRAAIAGLPETALVERFSNLGLAYRQWAVNYPQHYQLIFGTPIPGYQAPAEHTVPAAAQSLLPLIETLQALFDTGRLRVETAAPMTPELGQMVADWQASGVPAEAEVLYLALVVWSRVHGLVSIEIGEQFPAFIADPGEIFRREIKNMIYQYIKGE
jgi:AcrR family transcriptional regulator